MDEIKILMVIPYLPNEKNVATIFAKNILHSIEKKIKTKLIWILQTPSQNFENIFPNVEIKPIQNFSDACDIMDKEKPDVVITESSFSLSSYPFILAAKTKKIPIVSYYHYGHDFNITSFDSFNSGFLSKLKRFFSKSKDDCGYNPFSRGVFYLYKYFFYLKTLKSSSVGFSNFFSDVVESLWMNSFGTIDKKFDVRLITDKICLPNDNWIEHLEKFGIPKTTLVVTGSPIFDNYNFSKIKPQNFKQKNTIKILLVTASHVSHGFVSEKEYYENLFKIIFEIQKNPNFSLDIKIHPTSENIQSYSKILKEFNSSIQIFQQENLSDVLNTYDVAISFGIWTGAHLDILVSGTPLIMMTVFDNPEEIAVLKYNCAYRCDFVSDLEKIINNLSVNPIPINNIRSFLHLVSNPFDGKASERFAEIIISTIKN